MFSGSTRRLDGMSEIKYLNTAHVRCRFRNGREPYSVLCSLPPVEAIRAFQYIILLLKALYLPGLGRLRPAPSWVTEGAGLLCSPAPFYSRSRLLPARSLFLLLPAGSGTFMFFLYSCGQNVMHNVQGPFPRLCLGKLDLSNTPVSRKTLSLVKPPDR